MEVLGGVSAALIVAELGIRTATALGNFAAAIKTSNNVITVVVGDLRCMAAILHQIEQIANIDHPAEVESPIPQNLRQEIEHCRDGCKASFVRIDEALRKASEDVRNRSDEQAWQVNLSAWEKIRWPLLRTQLLDMRRDLEAAKATLSLVLGVANLHFATNHPMPSKQTDTPTLLQQPEIIRKAMRRDLSQLSELGDRCSRAVVQALKETRSTPVADHHRSERLHKETIIIPQATETPSASGLDSSGTLPRPDKQGTLDLTSDSHYFASLRERILRRFTRASKLGGGGILADGLDFQLWSARVFFEDEAGSEPGENLRLAAVKQPIPSADVYRFITRHLPKTKTLVQDFQKLSQFEQAVIKPTTEDNGNLVLLLPHGANSRGKSRDFGSVLWVTSKRSKSRPPHEDQAYRRRVRTHLAKAGYYPNQIDTIIAMEDLKDSQSDTSMIDSLKGNQKHSMLPPDGRRQIFPKIRRKDIDLRTLKHFQLEWEYDLDTNWIVILQELIEEDTDVLFYHTQKLREKDKKQTQQKEGNGDDTKNGPAKSDAESTDNEHDAGRPSPVINTADRPASPPKYLTRIPRPRFTKSTNVDSANNEVSSPVRLEDIGKSNQVIRIQPDIDRSLELLIEYWLEGIPIAGNRRRIMIKDSHPRTSTLKNGGVESRRVESPVRSDDSSNQALVRVPLRSPARAAHGQPDAEHDEDQDHARCPAPTSQVTSATMVDSEEIPINDTHQRRNSSSSSDQADNQHDEADVQSSSAIDTHEQPDADNDEDRDRREDPTSSSRATSATSLDYEARYRESVVSVSISSSDEADSQHGRADVAYGSGSNMTSDTEKNDDDSSRDDSERDVRPRTQSRRSGLRRSLAEEHELTGTFPGRNPVAESLADTTPW